MYLVLKLSSPGLLLRRALLTIRLCFTYDEYNSSVERVITRTAVFYSCTFCALPDVRHASCFSRLVSWVTTSAVTFIRNSRHTCCFDTPSLSGLIKTRTMRKAVLSTAGRRPCSIIRYLYSSVRARGTRLLVWQTFMSTRLFSNGRKSSRDYDYYL